ncbi:MAG: response regulator [Actinomycetota bacterium]
MLRLMVIDDDPLQAEIMRRLLKAHDGVEASIFQTADAAIEQLHKTKRAHFPHLVVLDLRMPGLDGHAVQRVLGEDERLRAIPVVVLSGSTLEHDAAQAYELGASAYLHKPDELDDLRELLADLVGLWWRVTPRPGGAAAPSVVS